MFKGCLCRILPTIGGKGWAYMVELASAYMCICTQYFTAIAGDVNGGNSLGPMHEPCVLRCCSSWDIHVDSQILSLIPYYSIWFHILWSDHGFCIWFDLIIGLKYLSYLNFWIVVWSFVFRCLLNIINAAQYAWFDLTFAFRCLFKIINAAYHPASQTVQLCSGIQYMGSDIAVYETHLCESYIANKMYSICVALPMQLSYVWTHLWHATECMLV